MTPRIIQILTIAIAMALFCRVEAIATDGGLAVAVDYKGKKYVGKPLAWDGSEVVLLRRDGRLAILPARKQSDMKQLEKEFRPLSSASIRKKLVNEFGSKYQISVTRNFVVVHPIGESSKWAKPFETLYQRFRTYFTSRGVEVSEPEFPMVAVVLRTRGEFDRFLKSYHDYDRDILGYYSPRSNRIITFDQSKGKKASRGGEQSWFFNASTIIHEATHQSAFNTGIHSRFGPVPRWISEGLAMMFEAPGVNNSNYFSSRKKRINRERLIALKYSYKRGQVENRWVDLISGDRLFREDPNLAYSMSWGLTFFLAESYPREYIQYLQNDARRQDFMSYSPRQRRRDFEKFFGEDHNELEARIKKFFEKLEIPK